MAERPAGLDEPGARHRRGGGRRAAGRRGARHRRPGDRTPGLVLCVLVADCVPVLLADHDAGVVAAVHAGREGVRQGVVPAALSAMASLGARARHVTALLGPAVCGACYEVPEAMQREVARVAPAAAVRTRKGTPGLDLRAGIAEVLRRRRHAPGRARPAVHRRGPLPLLPPARRRHRPPGRPGLARLGDAAEKIGRMTDLAGNLRAVRARIDAAARAAGRDPASVRAARGEQDLAGGRRPGPRRAGAARLRREPRPGAAGQGGASSPTCRCAGTSSASCSATRPPPWPGWARSCTPSTARPWPAPSTGPGRTASRPVDVLVQVDLGGAAGELAARGGAAPGRRARRWPTSSRRAPACGCAGSWRSRRAGRTRRRRSPGWPSWPPRAGRPPGGRGAVGGHERRPRGRRRGRRDGCACRNRVVRRSPPSLRERPPATRVTPVTQAPDTTAGP